MDSNEASRGFNGVFLVFVVLSSVLAIFFLLYFNRLFASFISYLIRLWTWRQHKIWIDIQALQVSLLGGRVFFTGLRYHGTNETILIQNGHITWSYWLRRVREVDLRKASKEEQQPRYFVRVEANKKRDAEASQTAKDTNLPCRINVSLNGLEWFVYNRTPAYESLLNGMLDTEVRERPGATGSDSCQDRHNGQAVRRHNSTSEKQPQERDLRPLGTEASALFSPSDDISERLEYGGNVPLFLNLFPIHVECSKAAMVMGNENTKSILLIRTDAVRGEVSASASPGPDLYRQLFKMKFTHPIVEMQDNDEYREEQNSRALREKRVYQETGTVAKRSFFRHKRSQIVSQLQSLLPCWSKSVESFSQDSDQTLADADHNVLGSDHWQGLARYMDENHKDNRTRWASVEYAAIPTVIESPEAAITMYWDVVGKVAAGTGEHKPTTNFTDINGDSPPAWAIDISMKGGTINYGPWADRHRADLQNMFFPALCKDARPASRIPVGENRVPTRFALFFASEEPVTLRIPIREESKNWRYQGKEAPPTKKERTKRWLRSKSRKQEKPVSNSSHDRPYGWFELKVDANATVNYSMDMVAGKSGFTNILRIDLPHAEISSSVNHSQLWRSGPVTVNCDMSTPLKWNGLRTWSFDVSTNGLELFLLRDHVFLITDLVDDWGSGPAPEYLTFTPFQYKVNLDLQTLNLHLNVNDSNIINDPTNFDDNAFLTFSAPRLTSQLCIPIDKFRPTLNTIPFKAQADTLSFSLRVPPWNTQAAFLTSSQLGYIENFVLGGKYHYNTITSPTNTDTLVLDISAQSPWIHIHGFLVRYFIVLKDNYFGDSIHFKTLEEHQEILAKENKKSELPIPSKPHVKSNDLDVILTVAVDDPKVILPANLYSANNNIQLEAASLSVDLRLTNYYMDMALLLSPVSLSLGTFTDGTTPYSSTSGTQMFIDGITIHGHRLFGLPPTEPTYMCNWDFAVGAITGECEMEFLNSLVLGVRSFAFSFDDDENALVQFNEIVFHDATFLRAHIESILVWLHVEEAAFLFSAGTVDVNLNDWAQTQYSSRVDAVIPDIRLSCIDSDSAARIKTRQSAPVHAEASLETSVRVAIVTRKANFIRERELQQEMIHHHDQPTKRTPFLLIPSVLQNPLHDNVDFPAQSVPPVPGPEVWREAFDDRTSFSTAESFPYRRRLQPKSSFLSIRSSASGGSVVRPRSSVVERDRDHEQPIIQLPESVPNLLAEKLKKSAPRSIMHRRDPSASTGQQSDFYSAVGDYVERWDAMHTSVAFSSPYYPPYFPLESVRPETAASWKSSTERDTGNPLGCCKFELEDIDASDFMDDCVYKSILIELPLGFDGFMTPLAVQSMVKLSSAARPFKPEDIIDTLQLDTVGDIMMLKKNTARRRHVDEFLVRIPHSNFRFLNASCWDTPCSPEDGQDHYSLVVTNFTLAARNDEITPNLTDVVDARPTRISFNLTFDLANLSAAEKLAALDETHAVLLVEIENATVSLGTKEVRYFDSEIGAIKGSTSSEKVHYLAPLLHRAELLVEKIRSTFESQSSVYKSMVQHFIYSVVEEGEGAHDPPFLSRPSAVLRSANSHLRTEDSWKLVSRLRQMWRSLSSGVADQLTFRCQSGVFITPDDTRHIVLLAFSKWRSWDLENLSSSLILNKVFGTVEPLAISKPRQSLPLLAILKISDIEFLLDPGAKQNQVTLHEITIRIETKDPGVAAEPNEKPDNLSCPITEINICCGDSNVSFNWEMCELVQGILWFQAQSEPKSRKYEDDSRSTSVSSSHARSLKSSSRQDIHIVFALGRALLDIETINLHVQSDWRDIQSSILLSHGGETYDTANIALKCNTMKSQLQSHAQLMARVEFISPSIFALCQLERAKTLVVHAIKSTASCHHVALSVNQDPISLLEVADLLVKDEAARLYQMRKQMPSKLNIPHRSRSQSITERLSSTRLDITLFLEGYLVNIPLLQKLVYHISSQDPARASIAAHLGKELKLDFDIQRNHHKMLMDVRKEPRVLSVLEIPPTNGRISSYIENGVNSVSIVASVQLITLDASEVYNLLTALNRPEIGNAINDIQEQGNILQEHVLEVFGTALNPETPKPRDSASENDNSRLVYSAHLAFEGLEIFGNTPLKSEIDPEIARLSFCLGRVQLEATNKLQPRNEVLEYPELRMILRHISFEILKGARHELKSCGSVIFGVLLTANSRPAEDGVTERTFNLESHEFQVNLSPDTISTMVDILGHFRDKIEDVDTSKELEYLRKLRQTKPRSAATSDDGSEQEDFIDSFLSSFVYILDVRNIQICWLAAGTLDQLIPGREDLLLGLERIAFTTRRKKTAKLTIENFQLQMVPPNHDKMTRSANSALLPEVVFNIAYYSTAEARRFAFQAVGKSLDLRLTSGFIIPASNLSNSIALSAKNVQQAYEYWGPTAITEKPATNSTPRPFFAKKRLESLLVDADFAGAVVHLSGKRTEHERLGSSRTRRFNMAGKYGQFNPDETGSSTVLKSPGLAVKMEYRDIGKEDPSLYAEIKIDASSNTLYPSVVPLIMEMTSSVKEVVSNDQEEKKAPYHPPMTRIKSEDEKILTADPAAVIGRLRLNIGLRICRQEFSLSCQPIARVAATTRFEDIYFTVNTVRSAEQGNFFAISGAFRGLQASVQHVYSRESTGSFEVDSIVLSLMNSKHVSGTSGVSAILKVTPMKVSINAKQLHDFFLFGEIWIPAELKQKKPVTTVPKLAEDTSQSHLVQRYQEVAATAAFPWTATISIAALQVNVDLGQALGKSVFAIEGFWVSSKKTSDWEQNLCLGFERIGVDCTGRMSGFVSLQSFKLRTAIQWPQRERALNETPLVQASIGFSQFRVKAAFDYQPFLVADITTMEFLMYNVRRGREGSGDRLVAIFDSEAVQIFGTATSAAQGVALWQAIQKLIQERKSNFETSLREIEKFMMRRAVSSLSSHAKGIPSKLPEDDTMAKSPISLDTDVVVTLKILNLGVFPNTFLDRQVFKMEALDAQVRFAASIEERQIHSILGVTLGQLRIGLAAVRNSEGNKAVGDLSVEEVVLNATGSRGGTILKVPKVEAVMQTWQQPSSMHIDYIFKSAFSGKVEVGWNYSRVSYIKGMWANHSKALEETWGRELQPLAAIKVTGMLAAAEKDADRDQQKKITAEVNVPQSRYNYRALEPPIIETPQLREMGEATPPLEWIGLHRDRLPNLTHQVVIVTLLELAGEVEDAYSRILGTT